MTDTTPIVEMIPSLSPIINFLRLGIIIMIGIIIYILSKSMGDNNYRPWPLKNGGK